MIPPRRHEIDRAAALSTAGIGTWLAAVGLAVSLTDTTTGLVLALVGAGLTVAGGGAWVALARGAR